jgi:hypothetical protein
LFIRLRRHAEHDEAEAVEGHVAEASLLDAEAHREVARALGRACAICAGTQGHTKSQLQVS